MSPDICQICRGQIFSMTSYVPERSAIAPGMMSIAAISADSFATRARREPLRPDSLVPSAAGLSLCAMSSSSTALSELFRGSTQDGERAHGRPHPTEKSGMDQQPWRVNHRGGVGDDNYSGKVAELGRDDGLRDTPTHVWFPLHGVEPAAWDRPRVMKAPGRSKRPLRSSLSSVTAPRPLTCHNDETLSTWYPCQALGHSAWENSPSPGSEPLLSCTKVATQIGASCSTTSCAEDTAGVLAATTWRVSPIARFVFSYRSERGGPGRGESGPGR